MPDKHVPGLRWESIDGAALQAELEIRGSVSSVVPSIAAIYMWRLRLRPTVNRYDQAGLISHVERVTSLPQGRIADLKMTRSLRLESLIFGGSGLPQEKVDVLRRLVSSKSGAQLLCDFLGDLESRLPALYVGESGRLPQRILDHLKGRTEFGVAVGNEAVMTWADLTLEFVRTGDARDGESANRQVLEYLATILTISNYTQRAG